MEPRREGKSRKSEQRSSRDETYRFLLAIGRNVDFILNVMRSH